MVSKLKFSDGLVIIIIIIINDIFIAQIQKFSKCATGS